MAVRTPRAGMPARPRLLTPVLVVVALVLVLTGVGVSLYTDLLWFRNVGFSEVFSTVLTTRILLFVGFGLLMAVLVGANITIAYKGRPPFRPMSLEQQNLERYRVGVEPYLLPLVLLASGVFGLFAGLSAASRWQSWLLWRNRTDFGVLDPQFSRDVSYYAMTYPFQRFVLGFLLTAVVLSFIAAAATHYLFGGLRLQTAGEKVSPAARAHLSVLVGIVVLLKAVAYYLDRFGLAFSERGFVQGASYTDVNALLPAKNILIGVAVLCALLFFANIVVRNILLPAGALALLVLSAVVLGGIFPVFTQQYRVKPNELERESPYIARNIQATREAYGISGAVVTPYGEQPPGVREAVSTSAEPNARLLDPNQLSATFEQLERLRQYFGVTDSLDIDRYEVDGSNEDFVVAAREVDQTGLSLEQRNWINERLTYTHGNGLIAARADQVDPNGRPVFESPGIGGVEDGPVRVDQPRIYFGEQSPLYSVVNTDTAEIDGPASGRSEGDQQATFRYDGDGGVELSNTFRKVAYALKFREKNLLLSGAVNADSRIMYTREPRERVRKVAPFLELDQDPYPAAVNGKILWIVDGYTTSNGYPYSESSVFGDVVQDSQTGRQQPREQVNYIRNSVKATVDAYTGQVVLYKFGPRDAVVETWDKAFPGVLKDPSEISPELRSHLRYPEDLFKVQRELLGQYHVTNPATFFNREDAWGIPNDPSDALNDQVASQDEGLPPPAAAGVPAAPIAADTGGPAQPPYYSSLQLPEDDAARFRLSTSFVFRQRPNLAAFASVSSDEEDYGTIRVLQLPRGNPPNGPTQVANLFLTDVTVAEELFRFRRNNADVSFGNLLTLPLSGGLLYVQPVYVQAQGGQGFPTLQQVLVAYGDDVAAAPTLAGALQELSGQAPGTAPVTPPTTSPRDPATPPAQAPLADVAAAISAADQAFRDGQAAFGRGDFAAYGQAQQRLQEALARLTELQGTAASGASRTPAPG